MKGLELKLILITIIGLIIGLVAPEGIKIIVKTISYNFFAFLSLFGGVVIFSSMAPGMKEFFERRSRRNLLFQALLSALFIGVFFIIFRYEGVEIFTPRKSDLYFKLKVTPLMNLTTAVLVSAITGYVASIGDGSLDKIFIDIKKGISRISERFIFPAFFLSIPGIVIDLQVKDLFVSIFLKRNWIEIVLLLIFLLKIFYFSKKNHRVEGRHSRLLYMNLFILTVACPLFRGEIVNESPIYFMFYAFLLSFSILLVDDIPTIVLLGLFGEIGGVSVNLLGLLMILYFIFSPLEKAFMKKYDENIQIGRIASSL